MYGKTAGVIDSQPIMATNSIVIMVSIEMLSVAESGSRDGGVTASQLGARKLLYSPVVIASKIKKERFPLP